MTYDFESALQPVDHSTGNTGNTTYTQIHVPISVGVYGDFPQSHPRGDSSPSSQALAELCDLCEGQYIQSDGNLEDMLTEFVDVLERYSDAAYKMKKAEFSDVYAALGTRVQQAKLHARCVVGCARSEKRAKQAVLFQQKLLDKFDNHCRQLNVCGFNSSFYDANLIVSTLVRILNRRAPFGVKRPGRNGDDDGGDSGVRDRTCDVDRLDEEDEDETDDETDAYKCAIKKGNRFVTFQTNKLRFLDVLEYMGPCTLRKYCQCFLGDEFDDKKLFFPYELLRGHKDLRREGMPAYEDFCSTLTGENTLEEGAGPDRGRANYRMMCEVWDRNGCSRLEHLLKVYQMSDVIPFHKAVGKMLDMYLQLDIRVFDYLTLPGMAFDYAVRRSGGSFFLTPDYLSDWYYLLTSQIMGGFTSVLNQRTAEVGKTKIRENVYGKDALTTRAIVSYDFNSLYPHCMSQKLPCGMPMARYAPDFRLVNARTYRENSSVGILWARWLSHSKGVDVRHAGNGREFKVGGTYSVDAYLTETSECWDFHGCRWHYHENCPQNPSGDSPLALAKRAADERKRVFIENAGYRYHVVWECDFNKMKHTNAALRDFCSAKQPNDGALDKFDLIDFRSCFDDHVGAIDEKVILEKVKNDQLFGFLLVDVAIKPEHADEYEQYPVIIKPHQMRRADLDERQRERAERLKVLSNDGQRTVVGAKHAEQLLVTSEMVKFWLELGTIDVQRIYQIVEYTPVACLRSTIQNLSQLRRDGDVTPSAKPLGDAAKLISNSIYGRTLLRKDRYTSLRLCTHDDLDYMVNKPTYRNHVALLKPDEMVVKLNDPPVTQEHDPDMIYQVLLSKEKVFADAPVHLGSWILSEAKLHNMRFVRVLTRYLDPRTWNTAYCDTDSIFFLLAFDTIDECVVRDETLRREWFSEVRPRWFVPEFCDRGKCKEKYVDTRVAGDPWVRPECCQIAFDWWRRHPGLMKVEATATKFTANNPKAYYMEDEATGQVKKAHKGVQRRAGAHLDYDAYRKCQEEEVCPEATNVGFVAVGGCMFTRQQTKRALNPVNPKRAEHPDHPLYTFTLDV